MVLVDRWCAKGPWLSSKLSQIFSCLQVSAPYVLNVVRAWRRAGGGTQNHSYLVWESKHNQSNDERRGLKQTAAEVERRIRDLQDKVGDGSSGKSRLFKQKNLSFFSNLSCLSSWIKSLHHTHFLFNRFLETVWYLIWRPTKELVLNLKILLWNLSTCSRIQISRGLRILSLLNFYLDVMSSW